MSILITGSTDGIGKETAFKLAYRGEKVIIHGKDEEKCIKVMENIKSKSNNSEVYYICSDLSEVDNIYLMSEKILNKFSDLNILINNAGVFKSMREVNSKGIELTFMINYLAVYLLTGLLLRLLYKNKKSRVINVASMAHSSYLDFNNINGEDYDGYTAYSFSKLEDIMFTFYLALKLEENNIYPDITVNCLHPGVISTKLLHSGWGMGGAPASEAADRILCMLSDEVKDINGKYFFNKRVSSPANFAYNKDAQEKLWKISEELTGFKYKFNF